MKREGMTVKEATQEWVREFNAIPKSLIIKLTQLNPDELNEITPPGYGNRVCVLASCEEIDGENKYGHIVGKAKDSDKYIIRIDGTDDVEIEILEEDFEVERDGSLPTWGTMWSFGEQLDNDWIVGNYCESGLQAMADCGFRIYKQEDCEYIFGIDGAGYNFYDDHWIPLYKARGLSWHDKKTEVV